MKHFKWLYLFIPISLFLICGYILSFQKLRDFRTSFIIQQEARVPALPPALLKALSGEFKCLVADLYFLEAVTYIGALDITSETSPEIWDKIYGLLSSSMSLDPYFKDPYHVGQAFLPWDAKRPELAIKLLETAMENRSWDWMPYFYAGFDYFYFLKNNSKGSEYLIRGSRVPNSPLFLATLGSRLSQKAGRTELCIEFLKALYNQETNKQKKQVLLERILLLQGSLVLEEASGLFQKVHGHPAQSIHDLVRTGLLRPEWDNPSVSYRIVDGKVILPFAID